MLSAFYNNLSKQTPTVFKSIKEQQRQPGLVGPRFWRKGKEVHEKRPTFNLTRSLGSFVLFGGLEMRG